MSIKASYVEVPGESALVAGAEGSSFRFQLVLKTSSGFNFHLITPIFIYNHAI